MINVWIIIASGVTGSMKISMMWYVACRQSCIGKAFGKTLETAFKGLGFCLYVAQKFQEGMKLWLNNWQSRWEGHIPPYHDVVGRLTFQAYLDRTIMGWDQAFRRKVVNKIWIKSTLAYAKEKHMGDLVLLCQNNGLKRWYELYGKWLSMVGSKEMKPKILQMERIMAEVDSQIRVWYEQDQGKLREDDKSFFLLPVEVIIKRHNQKRKWVLESVDLAFNAWHHTWVAEITDEACWLYPAPLWKRNRWRHPWWVQKKNTISARYGYLQRHKCNF